MRALLALLAVLPLAATAAEFNAVQLDKSRVSFVSKQMGVPIEGEFRKFAAQLALDPARPEAGRAQVDIDLASVDTGSREADEEVKGKGWFNVAAFPTARFVSTGLKALGGGRFEASGQMTLKGHTRAIAAPFSLRLEGANAVLEGSLPIMRLQYGIGEGMWADTATVADEVQIKFRFTVAAGTK